MPGPYEVLNARVKQKIATESDWIAQEADFGVIFEGEQAFVLAPDGETPVNFKIGDGTKTFSELPYFIAYYTGVTNQKILSYINQNANLTIPSVFKNNSQLMDLVFINNSGSPVDLKVGTTDGGNDICEVTIPIGPVTLGLKKFFQSVSTLYLTGLAGIDYSLFVLYFQLDETPAIPPSGGGSGMYKPGTVGMFFPLYAGHENDVWDFVTGMGKADTGYENCALMGSISAPVGSGMDDAYPVGFKTGDTLGGLVGNSDNKVGLTVNNIPKHKHLMFNGDTGGNGQDLDDESPVCHERNGGIQRDYNMRKSPTGATRGSTSFYGTDPSDLAFKFNIQPKSRKFLFFIAIS